MPKMKIVSYNISSCSQKKVDELLNLQADIYVAPEISCNEEINLPSGFEMAWNGLKWTNSKGAGVSKGLGVIWKKESAFVPEWHNPNLNYAIPLLCNDILVLGIWPTKDKKLPEQSYSQIARNILESYEPHFKPKTIITGDFNLFFGNGKNRDADIVPINDFLESNGFKSLYHKTTGESFGSESKTTYFHQFKETQPFFLDYTYSNFSVKNYELLPWNKEFSDHVGQVIKIEDL